MLILVKVTPRLSLSAAGNVAFFLLFLRMCWVLIFHMFELVTNRLRECEELAKPEPNDMVKAVTLTTKCMDLCFYCNLHVIQSTIKVL